MKILYASCRYDPLDRDAGSGVDFNFHEALQLLGNEVQIIGPFKDQPAFSDKVFKKVHRLFSRKLTAKFSETYLHSCASKVDEKARVVQPDAIVTHNLIPLVYSRSDIPVIYKSEAILYNMHEQWPTYSKFEFQHMLRWEAKALQRATLVVTASRWAEDALLHHYGIPESRIVVVPVPSSLPAAVIPTAIEEKYIDNGEIHLLAVAKNSNLKGTDIAIESTRRLRANGVKAVLRIVGQEGKGEDGIEFMGLFKKADPVQLKEYVSNYRWANLLFHPARYEAAGIVCSEAAAFGVPTITNDVGGLATTVVDGVSGFVLQRGSTAEEYIKAIEKFLENPELYARMRAETRKRYEQELNWTSAGKRILDAFIELRKPGD